MTGMNHILICLLTLLFSLSRPGDGGIQRFFGSK